MRKGFEEFQKQILHPVKFRLFMLRRLPSALFSGLQIQKLTDREAVVSVRYKWFTQNPFRSMYFAVQSMAAEMSTGLLASGHVYKREPAVSMLVVGLEATFVKKATDTVFFTCTDGEAINEAIELSMATGEGQMVKCYSVGKNIAGDTVSEFRITWSFKARK